MEVETFIQISPYNKARNKEYKKSYIAEPKQGRHCTEEAFALLTKQSWVRIPTFFQMIFQAQCLTRKPQ